MRPVLCVLAVLLVGGWVARQEESRVTLETSPSCTDFELGPMMDCPNLDMIILQQVNDHDPDLDVLEISPHGPRGLRYWEEK